MINFLRKLLLPDQADVTACLKQIVCLSTAYFLPSDKPFFFLVDRQVKQAATIPIWILAAHCLGFRCV